MTAFSYVNAKNPRRKARIFFVYLGWTPALFYNADALHHDTSFEVDATLLHGGPSPTAALPRAPALFTLATDSSQDCPLNASCPQQAPLKNHEYLYAFPKERET